PRMVVIGRMSRSWAHGFTGNMCSNTTAANNNSGSSTFIRENVDMVYKINPSNTFINKHIQSNITHIIEVKSRLIALNENSCCAGDIREVAQIGDPFAGLFGCLPLILDHLNRFSSIVSIRINQSDKEKLTAVA
ncbi:hypothetical protein ACJX0J_015350, partial [Zea mays]